MRRPQQDCPAPGTRRRAAFALVGVRAVGVTGPGRAGQTAGSLPLSANSTVRSRAPRAAAGGRCSDRPIHGLNLTIGVRQPCRCMPSVVRSVSMSLRNWLLEWVRRRPARSVASLTRSTVASPLRRYMRAVRRPISRPARAGSARFRVHARWADETDSCPNARHER